MSENLSRKERRDLMRRLPSRKREKAEELLGTKKTFSKNDVRRVKDESKRIGSALEDTLSPSAEPEEGEEE